LQDRLQGHRFATSRLCIAEFEADFDYIEGELRRVGHTRNMTLPGDTVRPATEGGRPRRAFGHRQGTAGQKILLMFLPFVDEYDYASFMNSAQPFPQPDPSDPGPAADPAESAGNVAADRAADLRDLDEISAIALGLLRALRIETLDPWNSPTCLPGERVRAGDPPSAYCRLTRTVRVNLAVRARMVEGGSDEAGAAAAIVRQDQIRMLTESSSIGMDLLRALHQEVVDPDNAPTARQGRRVGAGDPALALSRIARAIRLNHAIKARIAEGSLGRRRQSRSRDAGPSDAPVQGSADPRNPAGHQAAAARSPSSVEAQRQESGEPAVETDGFDEESEDLFGDLDEDFEVRDEFAGLDGLSLEECMDLVRRDFARCFQGKARVAGTAEPGEFPGGGEPAGRDRPGGDGTTADPASIPTIDRPATLRTWFERRAGTGVPDDSSGEAPVESPPAPPARGRDPP
jgi:hypothetical protein